MAILEIELAKNILNLRTLGVSKNVYDLIILGADLSSLLIAGYASSHGLKVLVTSKGENIGGTLTPTSTPQGPLFRDFGYWPSSDGFVSTLRWIEEVSGCALATDLLPRPPVTFQKGQMVSFVGFGDKAPECVDVLRSYLDYENSDLQMPLSTLIEALTKTGAFEIRRNFAVEQFQFHDGSITAATSLDGLTLFANKWVLSDSVKNFFHLLPSEHYSAREQARLHRSKLWTQVSLHIMHPTTISTERGVHVMVGTTDDAVPSVGGFEIPSQNGNQASHWLCFIDPDAGDDEATAHALREMKRQIKRAYPNAMEKNLFERISVEPEAAGAWLAKTDQSGRWQGLKNCWVIDSDNMNAHSVFGRLRQSHTLALSIVDLPANKIQSEQPVDVSP